ncbi:DUF6612 family protein [Piscibacillus halophilus]|uniref:DUF6612 family protein n=1 Tax=Piscibacillus halophilus TaxID=571933 RepID=UPI0024095062|nr:DUF6612 family protein [Piscibacillus halophilus]
MLRQFFIMMLGAMLILVACNTSDETNEQMPSTNSDEISEDKEKEGGDRSLEEDEEENEEPNHSINDLEELFLQMKAATQSIKSVTITGSADAENTIAGATIENTMEMTVDATLDPFVQHAIYTVTAGEGGKTEWYATDDEMFLNMDDSGWRKVIHPVSVTAASLIHRDDYFDHFILYKDLFELKEDNEHYIITYIGPDEQYKEVFYGGIISQEFGEMVKEMTGLISEIEMSGAVEMKVSKDSFLIVEQHSIYKGSMEQSGMTLDTIQDGTYTYSYNEVSNVEIPEEVIKNAKE